MKLVEAFTGDFVRPDGPPGPGWIEVTGGQYVRASDMPGTPEYDDRLDVLLRPYLTNAVRRLLAEADITAEDVAEEAKETIDSSADPFRVPFDEVKDAAERWLRQEPS
jgi:hypothetical protein